MNTAGVLKTAAIVSLVIAVGMAAYLVNASKALSYLSTDPLACINCHAMNPHFASWQHSAHGRDVGCIDCHLPHDSIIGKYLAKARDGWNHSVAFTFNTYSQNIQISDHGAKRVQANCVSCHAGLAANLVENEKRYHDFTGIQPVERKCWECHRRVPHGIVRSQASTPYNLGVREL